jgi:hypothetical protein
MQAINDEIRNSIARIEVMTDGGLYWEVGAIELSDDNNNVIEIEIDYSKINQPFEELDDMLTRIAEYFSVDVDIVEYCE